MEKFEQGKRAYNFARSVLKRLWVQECGTAQSAGETYQETRTCFQSHQPGFPLLSPHVLYST